MGEVDKKKMEEEVKAVMAVFEDISSDTGVSISMIHLIWSKTNEGIKKQGSLRGADVVKLLITELHLNRKGYVDEVLRKNGIINSSDIGKVIFGLTDAKLLRREESDKQEDFEGHFETDKIWEYIKREKIKKESNHIYEASIVVFVTGVIIIIVDREKRLPDIWWMIAWILLAISAVLYFFRVPIQKMITKED